jgi:hypothetical protein
MKKILSTFLFAALIQISFAGEIIVEGTYQGKNIFISNPFREDGSFCIISILINGKLITDRPQSSALEINIAAMGFKIGDALKLVIVHQDDCKPTILSDTFYTPVKTE